MLEGLAWAADFASLYARTPSRLARETVILARLGLVVRHPDAAADELAEIAGTIAAGDGVLAAMSAAFEHEIGLSTEKGESLSHLEIQIVGHRPTPTPEQEDAAEKLDRSAADHAERRLRSQEQSDADGFLSQWASGLSDQLDRRRAQILRDGGSAVFAGLFERLPDDSPGRRVRAKIVTSRFGDSWCLVGADDKPTGHFYPAYKTLPVGELDGRPVRSRSVVRTKVWKAGMIEAGEWAPARADIIGRGTGLSGSAWVATLRADRGYPEHAEPWSDEIASRRDEQEEDLDPDR